MMNFKKFLLLSALCCCHRPPKGVHSTAINSLAKKIDRWKGQHRNVYLRKQCKWPSFSSNIVTADVCMEEGCTCRNTYMLAKILGPNLIDK